MTWTELRITPAHAGNSSPTQSFPTSPRDHPRTCGEQCTTLGIGRFSIGSPPHMRGTVSQVHSEVVEVGITPAHAGNSLYLLVHQENP